MCLEPLPIELYDWTTTVTEIRRAVQDYRLFLGIGAGHNSFAEQGASDIDLR